MGKIIQSLLDSLKLNDEEDEDEYEDEEYEIPEENERRRDLNSKRENPPLRKYENLDDLTEEDDEEPIAQRRTFTQNRPAANQRLRPPQPPVQPGAGRSVPVRTSSGDKRVHIINPRSFEDAREICDDLKNGGIIFMNYQGVNTDMAQRIMDYISGAAHLLNGQILQVTELTFIAAPGDTDIDDRILDQINYVGNGYPTFRKY